jgi:hypothetical protein
VTELIRGTLRLNDVRRGRTARPALCLAGGLFLVLQFLSFGATKPEAQAPTPRQGTMAQAGHQHDFDWELGDWNVHLRRLLHPLTGSKTWVEFEGTARVRKVWNGRANLLELELNGPAGHIEGLSLRLHNPRSGQWSVYFATSDDGTLGTDEQQRQGYKNREAIREPLGVRIAREVVLTPR